MRPIPCLWCDELILHGDLVHSLIHGMHYACALRAVMGSIGHIHGTCSCYRKDGTAEDDPPGISKRQAANLVADYVRNQQQPQAGRN